MSGTAGGVDRRPAGPNATDPPSAGPHATDPPSAGPPATGRAAGMLATVRHLAADGFSGRRVGTPGGRAAASWLAGALRAAGATVLLDDFPLPGAVRELDATPLLDWTDGSRRVSLAHRRDFCEHLASAHLATPRTGALVTGDGGAPGAWVVVDGYRADQVARLAAAGCAGVLVPRGTDEAGWMPKMIAGPAPAGLPVLAVRTDIHRRMAGAAAAGAGSVTASVPLRTVDVTGTNVLGMFRPHLPGRTSVLLTAHADGVGDDPELRFPAAADNASGVAVVLDAARDLHGTLPPDLGLAVALLDGEEAGAPGSAHHARHVAPGTFVINIDGAARLGAAAAVEAGGPAQPLLEALDAAAREVGVPLRGQAMPSDNRRYAAAGLPAVGIGMGMPGYQTPAETPDRVDPGTLLAAHRLVVSTVHHLGAGFNPTAYPRRPGH